jgi:hypothetical protein
METARLQFSTFWEFGYHMKNWEWQEKVSVEVKERSSCAQRAGLAAGLDTSTYLLKGIELGTVRVDLLHVDCAGGNLVDGLKQGDAV